MTEKQIALMESLGWDVGLDSALSASFTMGQFSIVYASEHAGQSRTARRFWALARTICEDDGPDTIFYLLGPCKQSHYATLHELLCAIAYSAQKQHHLSDLVNGYTPAELQKLIAGK